MATFKKYKMKNGSERWMFKTYLGIDKVTGRQIQTTRRGFMTKKDASLAEKRLQHKVLTKGFYSDAAPTFENIALLWLENYKITVEASSYAKTIQLFKKYIFPHFGKLKMKNIDTIYCQKIVNEWYSTATNRNYQLMFNYVQKVFKYAMNIGVIDRNPTHDIIIPKRREPAKVEAKDKRYTRQELETLLNIIENEPKKYQRSRDYAIFRVLAFSGCRIGELLALNWNDIDFTENTISISKTLSYSKTHYISERTKTKKSTRTIPLDSKTMTCLKNWKMNQLESLFQMGLNRPAFVFTNFKNSFMINSTVATRLKVYQKRAGLPLISLHGFRHTHASLSLEAAADYKEIAERLGHSNIKTTMNTYTHLSKEQKEKTIEKFANYVSF